MSKSELLFVPLGGVGEIGMNLALYGYGPEEDRSWIMVDCGVTFPNAALPGVDLVLPDIRFAEELGDDLKAIIITHAHEDHYGALLSLWPKLQKPVWMTAFTAGLLEAKANSDAGSPQPISSSAISHGPVRATFDRNGRERHDTVGPSLSVSTRGIGRTS